MFVGFIKSVFYFRLFMLYTVVQGSSTRFIWGLIVNVGGTNNYYELQIIHSLQIDRKNMFD